MTDKSYFRQEKNEQIIARDKTLAEDRAKEKEKSDLDNPTHWRYKKSQNIKHGTTTMADVDKPTEKKEENKEKDISAKEASFTKEGAKILTREAQEKLLKQRGVKFSYKDKESDLIKKIIKSNPQE